MPNCAKRNIIILFVVFLTAHGAFAGAAEQVRGLIGRILPGHEKQFVVETIAETDGKDVFEIESQGGKIVLRGNSQLSQAVALNWYLKYYAKCHVSLNGRQLNLPVKLPVVPEKVRQVGWAKSRYFLNYCTFGYSMPWWDWAQWESFIDWMALNGINQPLAITGQEAVWQAVGKRLGMTDTEVEAFLPGPPYLPFCWMGCLDGFGGPLPKDWMPRHVELQKKILARERELGMTPVLQGFTGHVPEVLVKKFPEMKAHRINWEGRFTTWMLDPTDPLFQKLGTAWIEEQTKLFGTDHLYAADSFIEMDPPSGDLNYLGAAGRAIYNGMAKADPQAVWLLQGWTFFARHGYWIQPRIKAFLDAVPDDRLWVLDLFCENHPVWSETQGFYGKPWVWCFVYNFGNTTTIGGSGPLTRFNDLVAVRKNPVGQNARGVGLMMEGFSHNPLLYDLMFERAWRDDVELKSWMREFTRFRYGKANADAEVAWETMRNTLYEHGAGASSIIPGLPCINPNSIRHSSTVLARTWRSLLQAAPELGQSETYRHDVVNVGREFLSSHVNSLYNKAMAAYSAKDPVAYRQASAEILQLIRDEDELLATNDEFLLGKWIEDAQRWGKTDAERAKLEWNARRVVTLWGGDTKLRDYAWKQWSGMLTGFYAKRWEIFFQRSQAALDAGKPFDQGACHAEIYRFENDWSQARETHPAKATGDSLAVARRLFDKYCPRPIANLALNKPAACSFALPGMEAGFANDGIIDTESYWATDAAKDPASWWQVDLEKPTKVGRVVVVGYYGDLRHYGFTVEGSLDGKEWTMLSDSRDNKLPMTKDGYLCSFEKRNIRYIRITMTKNSVNTGRHLVEVLAFGE